MVFFVGAGPGAKDLITVQGAKLLADADVIIYAGSLVNHELLEYSKPNCEICNSAEMTLEEVIDVIESNDKKGKNIVRLHTGDQSIYGAVKEQIDILKKKSIAFKSVPGVSSFCAAAAALDLEYTLPNISQTVILTRMEGKTPVPDKESIEKLAAHKASMAIFLTSSMLDKLAAKLIIGGYDENTPAAIVYKASWADEIKIITTIKSLASDAEKHNIKKTALVLVGDFINCNYDRSKLYDPTFTHEFRVQK